LGAFGAKAEAAIPDLVKAIRSSSYLEKKLERIEIELEKRPTISGWEARRSLSDRAACSIALMGNKGVSAAVTLLKDQNSDLKGYGAWILGTIGPNAEVAVPELIATLKDKHSGVHLAAAEALGQIGKHAKRAIPSLATALKHGSELFRVVAAVAIRHIDPLNKDAISTLVHLLQSKDETQRLNAVYALQEVGKGEKIVIVALANTALQDNKSSVRTSATESLTELGQLQRLAVPVFVRALRNPDDRLRKRAAIALCEIRDQQIAIPDLIRALRDKNNEVRYYSAKALGAYGKKATAALPGLKNALKDPDVKVRQSARNAILLITE
jgi:HEAT repeat protein